MARTGVVYTETVVHAGPAAFASEVPYQVAIVDLDGGGKVTARVVGARVAIGEPMVEVDPLHDAPAFTRADLAFTRADLR